MKNWIIHKLGGHTPDEYREIELKYNAIHHAHEATLGWLKQPTLTRIETKGERITVGASVLIDDRYPADVLKRDMCRRMADELFNSKVVSFDVHDDYDSGGYEKIFRGEINVLMPVGITHSEMW